jgi:hypothetical protein
VSSFSERPRQHNPSKLRPSEAPNRAHKALGFAFRLASPRAVGDAELVLLTDENIGVIFAASKFEGGLR